MRTVSYRVDDLKKAVISLGYVGENEHTQVRIDAGELYAEYPGASVALTVQPPAGEAYPAVVTRDGNTVVWDVKDSDLVYEGSGEIQLTFSLGDVVAKTFIGRIRVDRSIIGAGDVPTPIEDFLAEAGEALTAIPETINSALAAAKESGEFDGADGFSPVVTVSEISGGHTVSVTDAEGTETFNVMDGEKGDPGDPGQDGAAGADGYSPSASVSKSGTVATIVITDKDGTTTATVSDGASADIIDDTAGSGDTGKVWSADKTASEKSALLSAITQSEVEENLLRSEMPGTSTTVTMDSNGNPTSIVHTANSTTVRTDSFVWGTGTVTETRTLANGKYITITTNLETLAQTISAVQEVA